MYRQKTENKFLKSEKTLYLYLLKNDKIERYDIHNLSTILNALRRRTMRKVLHKVKSQWIVLGVLGATVVSLGTADVRQVAADRKSVV